MVGIAVRSYRNAAVRVDAVKVRCASDRDFRASTRDRRRSVARRAARSGWKNVRSTAQALVRDAGIVLSRSPLRRERREFTPCKAPGQADHPPPYDPPLGIAARQMLELQGLTVDRVVLHHIHPRAPDKSLVPPAYGENLAVLPASALDMFTTRIVSGAGAPFTRHSGPVRGDRL